ncbi:hypothetical protein ABQX22_18230 [Xanthomonas sp. WHRI 1810A]|uniref:hypothetical protein n=1 Tax=Xanthomonas sp. WHRI 1810A TaxID=3161565 RepID=UPI0032E8962C
MATQTNSRELIVGDITVMCREMTVLQVRNWLETHTQPVALDIVDSYLFVDCTLDDLKRMTDLKNEVIDGLKPSQVQEVIAVCKELNPHFFAMLGRLGQALHLPAKA